MSFDLTKIDDIIKEVNDNYEIFISIDELLEQGISKIKLISANKFDDIITIWMTSYIPYRNITITYELEDGKTESEYREDIIKRIFDRLNKETEDIKRLTELTEVLEEMVENVKITYKGKEPRLVLELIYKGDKKLSEVFDTVRRTGGVTGRVGNKLKSANICTGIGRK